MCHNSLISLSKGGIFLLGTKAPFRTVGPCWEEWAELLTQALMRRKPALDQPHQVAFSVLRLCASCAWRGPRNEWEEGHEPLRGAQRCRQPPGGWSTPEPLHLPQSRRGRALLQHQPVWQGSSEAAVARTPAVEEQLISTLVPLLLTMQEGNAKVSQVSA